MCVFCEGKLESAVTDYIKNRETHVVMVREVPCEECAQCGEKFFDDSIVKELEERLGNVHYLPNEVAITVIKYGCKSIVA